MSKKLMGIQVISQGYLIRDTEDGLYYTGIGLLWTQWRSMACIYSTPAKARARIVEFDMGRPSESWVIDVIRLHRKVK